MSITKPNIRSAWANAGTATDPGSGVVNSGWSGSIGCPPFDWFNWWMKDVDNKCRYMMAAGIPAYDAAETYTVGDRVRYTSIAGEHTYMCTATTTGHAPTNPSDYWTLWAPRHSELPGLLGIALTMTGGTQPATFTVGNFQICFAIVDLWTSGNHATSKIWTFPSAFGAVFGVLTSSMVDYPMRTTVAADLLTTTQCTIDPSSDDAAVMGLTSFPIFCVAFGTIPA